MQNATGSTLLQRPLASTRFTTSDYPPDERHAAWLDQSWPALSSTLAAKADGAFDAHSERIDLGAFSITYGQYSAQSVHRSSARVGSDGIDHLCASLWIEGAAFSADYRTERCSLNLVDMATEWRHVSTACRLITFAVPRPMIEERGLSVRSLHGVTVDERSAMLLRSHLLQIRSSSPQMAADQGPALAQTIVELLAITVSNTGLNAPVALAVSESTKKLQALQLIETHLASSMIGPAMLCRELQISRSTLYRMFEDCGGVHQHILTRRLEHARLALLDVGNHAPIATIADQFGFCDSAHFSRAFRSAFGRSPREFRASENGSGFHNSG